MDEQILSEYAALTDVPCDSPLRKIDADDMMMLIFLLILFSSDPSERKTEDLRKQIEKMTEKECEKGGVNNDVQQADERA